MKIGNFANVVRQLLVGLVLAGGAMQASIAQSVVGQDGKQYVAPEPKPYDKSGGGEPTARDCSPGDKKGTCVEVILRYDLSKNEIRILDPQSRKSIVRRCQLCDPQSGVTCYDKVPQCQSAQGVNLIKAETVWIIRTKKSQCIIVGYSGGYPVEACFP